MGCKEWTCSSEPPVKDITRGVLGLRMTSGQAAGRADDPAVDQASPCEALPRLAELQKAEAQCLSEANTRSIILPTGSVRLVHPRAFLPQGLSSDWACPRCRNRGSSDAACLCSAFGGRRKLPCTGQHLILSARSDLLCKHLASFHSLHEMLIQSHHVGSTCVC